MVPPTDQYGRRPTRNWFAQLDESTPITVKAGVLFTAIGCAMASTWWAGALVAGLDKRIDENRAHAAAIEAHLQNTDRTVSEVQRMLERFDGKLDHLSDYLHGSHP